jgi:hypothetical protein
MLTLNIMIIKLNGRQNIMLDFLVLGIVPGTSITLTITWFLIISLAISLGILGYVERNRIKTLKEAHAERLKFVNKIVRQS